jgi:hypothetical protein
LLVFNDDDGVCDACDDDGVCDACDDDGAYACGVCPCDACLCGPYLCDGLRLQMPHCLLWVRLQVMQGYLDCLT